MKSFLIVLSIIAFCAAFFALCIGATYIDNYFEQRETVKQGATVTKSVTDPNVTEKFDRIMFKKEQKLREIISEEIEKAFQKRFPAQ